MIEKLSLPTEWEMKGYKESIGDYWDKDDHMSLIQGRVEEKMNEIIDKLNELEDRITPSPDDITQH